MGKRYSALRSARSIFNEILYEIGLFDIRCARIPAAPHMSADGAIIRGNCCRVPEEGIMEENVTRLAIDTNLARRFFKGERHVERRWFVRIAPCRA